MKKVVKAIMLCVLLTGCSKKMTCKSITTSDNLDITETTYIYHTLNKIEQIETTIKYEIKDEALTKGFNKIFEEIKENYKDESIEKEEIIENNIYELKIKYNPRKISKEMLEKLNSPLKLRKYKKYLETQNMICK